MVTSLLAYFVAMMTAFAVVMTVWIGLIVGSPFQRVHLQQYPLSPPMPLAADSTPAATAAYAEHGSTH
jgi:hypothetical protein